MSTPFDLAGKTAAVTGGGRGLGLGISTVLLEAGADVTFNDVCHHDDVTDAFSAASLRRNPSILLMLPPVRACAGTGFRGCAYAWRSNPRSRD